MAPLRNPVSAYKWASAVQFTSLTEIIRLLSYFFPYWLTNTLTNQPTTSTATSSSCEADSYSDSQKFPTLYGIYFKPSHPNSSKSALISAYVLHFQTSSVLQVSSSKASTSLLSQTCHNSQLLIFNSNHYLYIELIIPARKLHI